MTRPLLSMLLVAALLLGACAPSQRVYSLDPVNPKGQPLPLTEVRNLRLETGEAVAVDGRLELDGERFVGADGRSWPIGAVQALDYVDDQGVLRRARVESPEDLLAFDELPRLASVQLRDGRVIELGEDNPWSSWTDDRLGITVSPDGLEFEDLRLTELRTVTLYQSSFVESTFASWQFWVVGAGAAILIYVISTRSEANQAVR